MEEAASKRKQGHLYCVLRVDFFEHRHVERLMTQPRDFTWQLHFKVKAIVDTEALAQEEVERLNRLNGHKDCLYYYEKAPHLTAN